MEDIRHSVLKVPELVLRQNDDGIPSPQFDTQYLQMLQASGYATSLFITSAFSEC